MSKQEFIKGQGYVPSWYAKFPIDKLNDCFEDGGIPSGTVMQVQSSKEGTFKSTVALSLAATVQKQGMDVAYIDVENAVVWEEIDGVHRCQWFENIGLDSTNMYYIGGDSQEKTYENVKTLIKDYDVKFIVLDSIPAMEPEKIHNQEAGNNQIGLRAKINTVEFVKLTKLCRQYDATVCAINHKKAVITDRGSFGESAVGGRGVGFYSQLIIVNKRTTSQSQLEDKNIIDLDMYIEKNKFGKQFVPIKVKVEQGYGIAEEPDLRDQMMKAGLMEKKGSWYSVKFDEGWDSVAQGGENLIYWIRENKSQVKQMLNNVEEN